MPAFTDAAQRREWRSRGGLPPQTAVSRQACGGRGCGRAVSAGTHRRQEQKADVTLPYLTNGNVATVTGRIHGNGGIDMETENLHSYNYEAYNRRTTDYGNGRMEIATYHKPRLRHLESGMTPSGKVAETSDEAQEKRTRQQIYAIRRRIKGYAFTNSFRWFVTLTFNPEMVDSSDYETAKNTLLKWCRKMRDKHERFDYLIIPELHKSGAVHFHGLLGDIPACFAEAANPKTGKPIIKHGRQVYNLMEWEYGFSDCEEIESPERAASYITKYVTTALLTDKKMYNKKRYFNSQGLAKPVVAFSMSDNTELDVFTPNFGVIETDKAGKNIIDIGIYNLTKDLETDMLTQTDDSYLIIAKDERRKNSPTTGTAAKTGRKGESHEKDCTHSRKAFPH